MGIKSRKPMSQNDQKPPALIAELERRGLEVTKTWDGDWFYLSGYHARYLEQWIVDYVDKFKAAIDAMTIQRARRVHYRTHNDIPMDMPKKVEDVVWKVLNRD